MSEMLPCPFDCDNHGGRVVMQATQAHGGFQVFCNACNARGPVRHNQTMAVYEWNRRAAQPADRAAIIEECAGVVDQAVESARLNNPDSAHTRGANAYAAATAHLSLSSCALEIRALNPEGAAQPAGEVEIGPLRRKAERLMELASKIERASSESEESELCDQRDRILADFRKADAVLNHPGRVK